MTEMQDQIDRAYKVAASGYERARENQDLVPAARDRAIAATYTTLKATMDTIVAANNKATASRRDTLASKLYGLPAGGDAVSYRDAVTAARAIDTTVDGAAVLPLLEQARVSGDDLLTRGILATAYASGWSSVIEKHAADNPAAATDSEELWSLHRDTEQTAKSRMAAAALTYVPKPRELERYGDSHIRQLADE